MRKRKLINIKTSLVKWLSNKKKAIRISVANVLVLMLLSYFVNNWPLFTGENLLQYSWVEYIKGMFCNNRQFTNDDAIFINVGYDKKLIEHFDEFGFPIGNVPITDRQKLTQFLKMLNKTGTYRYVFLDVHLERGYEDALADSALVEEISKTKRIVIATHPGTELIDNSLYRVAAWNNYNSTIVSTNFNRYLYSADGKSSMPLFAYKELNGYSINKYGPFYFCNKKLCYNSLFLRFPVNEEGLEYGDNDNKQFYNLGNDILNVYSEKDLAKLCEAKYVFVGDMIEDLHDTYSGVKAGPIILYHAFKEIMKGRHYVNIWMIFFLCILFLGISLSLFSQKSWIDRIPIAFVLKSKTIRFLISFIGYSFILTICSIVMGFFFGRYISIMLPSLYFSIQKLIIDYKKR